MEYSHQRFGTEPLRGQDGSVKVRTIANLNGIGIGLGADEGMDSFRCDYRGAVRLNYGGEQMC